MIRNVSLDATALPSSSSSKKLKLKLNTKKKKKRSPVFPQRLYEMLEDAEQEGYSHLISWSPDGMSFNISYDAKNNSNNKSFVEVLKRRFNQTHFKSFLRQLQLYGFERQFKGARKGECHHPLFQRHHKELLFGKSIEEYQDATCTQHAILANRMMCTNQQQQLELISSTQEVDTNSIPSPPPLHRYVTTDEPTITTGTSTSSKCKYRSMSPIPITLTNLVLPDDYDDDDDDVDDDKQDNINQDNYDDGNDATTESNGSDNCSIGSNKVFNRTFFGTATDTVPISRKSKVLLMYPLIWNDTCDDYEYDCDCDGNFYQQQQQL